jgi:fimbrial chaperone protein
MRPVIGLGIFTALGCLLAGDLHAASLEISPVVITLAAGQTSAAIEVQNRGGTPAAIQGRAFDWRQAADDDVLTPTEEVILSPPIFTIPGGASQTLRLLLRGGRAGKERSYRLLLNEVPPANAAGRQVTIALQVSLPVIAEPVATGPAASLQWRAERGPDGRIMLTASNTGSVFTKVAAIAVTMSDGSHPKVVPQGKTPYVLPGAQRHWIVQGGNAAAGTPLRLSVTTGAGKSEQTLMP